MTSKQQTKLTGLDLLRSPFPDELINMLPKPTSQQGKCMANEKVNCKVCGGWHHPRVRHVAYVGHAALTDRLLQSDPNWGWQPVSTNDQGLPQFDPTGGLWINLTVCGVTRLGYGDAKATSIKSQGDMIKECIGDAIRNAAMRFGAALDLWFKGDLHIDAQYVLIEDTEEASKPESKPVDNTKPEPVQKPAGKVEDDNTYPAELFKKNFPKWKEAIINNKMTAEQVIKTVENKAPLSGIQKNKILTCKNLEEKNENT